MIYWLTGQPGAGKTSLSNGLKSILERKRTFTYKVQQIDGDNMRELFHNKDYSEKGRRYNIDVAQKIAHYLHNTQQDVIVSLVSPYRDQREEFKAIIGENITEIYLHTKDDRPRAEYKVDNYEPPLTNFIDFDTSGNLEDNLYRLCKTLKI